jgi:hypothetical protein
MYRDDIYCLPFCSHLFLIHIDVLYLSLPGILHLLVLPDLINVKAGLFHGAPSFVLIIFAYSSV